MGSIRALEAIQRPRGANLSHDPGAYGQEEDGKDNRHHWNEDVLWSSQLHCHRQCGHGREASDNRDQREILESTASKDFGYLIVRDVVATTGQLRNSQPISLQALGTSYKVAASGGRSQALKNPASTLPILWPAAGDGFGHHPRRWGGLLGGGPVRQTPVEPRPHGADRDQGRPDRPSRAAGAVRRPFSCAPVQIRQLWSGRGDLNPRPPDPQSGALPSCATPRWTRYRSGFLIGVPADRRTPPGLDESTQNLTRAEPSQAAIP